MILKDPNWAMGSEITDIGGNVEVTDKLKELEDKVDDLRHSMPGLKCLCSDISGQEKTRKGQASSLAPIRCGNVSEQMSWDGPETWTDVTSKDTDVRYKVKCKKGDYKKANKFLEKLDLYYNCTSQAWETREHGHRNKPFVPIDLKKNPGVIKCLGSEADPPKPGKSNLPNSCKCYQEHIGNQVSIGNKVCETNKTFTQSYKVGDTKKGWYLYNKGIKDCSYKDRPIPDKYTDIVASANKTLTYKTPSDKHGKPYKDPFDDPHMPLCGQMVGDKIPPGTLLTLDFNKETYNMVCTHEDPLSSFPVNLQDPSAGDWLKIFACYFMLMALALALAYRKEENSRVFFMKAGLLGVIVPPMIWFLYHLSVADDKQTDYGQTHLTAAWGFTIIATIIIWFALGSIRSPSDKFEKFRASASNILFMIAMLMSLLGVYQSVKKSTVDILQDRIDGLVAMRRITQTKADQLSKDILDPTTRPSAETIIKQHYAIKPATNT